MVAHRFKLILWLHLSYQEYGGMNDMTFRWLLDFLGHALVCRKSLTQGSSPSVVLPPHKICSEEKVPHQNESRKPPFCSINYCSVSCRLIYDH